MSSAERPSTSAIQHVLRRLITTVFSKASQLFFNTCYHALALFCSKTDICFFLSPSSENFSNLSIIHKAFGKDDRIVTISPKASLVTALYALAKAKVVVLDQSHSLISKVKLVDKTTCVQCWHSSGWYKKVGFDAKRPAFPEKDELQRIERIHRNIDYFIISDSKLVENYAAAFHILPSQVLPLGLARTDILFKTDNNFERDQFEKQFPKTSGKKFFLYAPTFRAVPKGHRFHEYHLDIKKLQERLGYEWAFLLRKHPSIRGTVPQGWIDVSRMPLESCLAVSDALATDYSSILFDYSYFQRPIFLIVPDDQEYQASQRGLYRTPHQLVGNAVCRSTDELIEKLSSGERFKHHIWQDYMSACDGHSTERVVSIINEIYSR